jgi:hypothetical protein
MSYPTWGGMDHIAKDRQEKVKSGVSWYRKWKRKNSGSKKRCGKWFRRKRRTGEEE